MRPQSAKAKGRKGQKEIVEIMQQISKLGEHDISFRSMGAQGTDIVKSELGFDVFPIAEECKWRAKIAVFEYYDQAKYHADKINKLRGPLDQVEPVTFLRQNGSKQLALVDAAYFLKMLYKTTRYKELLND